MDPDANLAEQREIVKRINGARDQGETPDEHDVFRLAELVEALDNWLLHAGALPTVWWEPFYGSRFP